MDPFNIKVEKANAVLKHHKLRKIANFFRLIEICAVLVLISRVSTHLPAAVKNSGEYFRDLSVILMSPRFVFVVGNLIVITLFAKSGRFSYQESAKNNSTTDLYQEFVAKSEKNSSFQTRKKHSICEAKVVPKNTFVSPESKSYRRTQSETFNRVNHNNSSHPLRRSETEKFMKVSDSDKKITKCSYSEDAMSNEEFRHKVEAFIARQKRLCKDEEDSYI